MTIKWARRLFLAAGIYGVVVVTPLFFLEQQLSERYPPAITHPELYYGFVSVTFGWQIVYLMLWRDPLRFRPIIVPAVVGKVGFASSVLVLVALQRLEPAGLVMAPGDLVLSALFLWAFFALGDQTRLNAG